MAETKKEPISRLPDSVDVLERCKESDNYAQKVKEQGKALNLKFSRDGILNSC